MSVTFRMQERFGSAFLADGDEAIPFLMNEVEPALERGESIVFDLGGVDNMTDSFANACFANLFARHPDKIAAQVTFKSCSPLIRTFLESAFAMSRRPAAH